MKVTAVIVTRGDVGLTEIIAGLPVDEVVVYDNSGLVKHFSHSEESGHVRYAANLGVYGRFAGIEFADSDVIYVQDDDCIIDAEAVIDAYEAGRLVANMPESRWADYPDSALIGWGAVFDRDLPQSAFAKIGFDGRVSPFIGDDWTDYSYTNSAGVTIEFEDTRPLLRTCDVFFSALTPRTVIDVGFEHLPWAEDLARAMFKQPGHKEERDRMLALARAMRTTTDDDRRGE